MGNQKMLLKNSTMITAMKIPSVDEKIDLQAVFCLELTLIMGGVT